MTSHCYSYSRVSAHFDVDKPMLLASPACMWFVVPVRIYAHLFVTLHNIHNPATCFLSLKSYCKFIFAVELLLPNAVTLGE